MKDYQSLLTADWIPLPEQFACGILCLLRSKAICNGYIELDHDCWCYVIQGKGIPSEHRGHYLYERRDFGRLPILPSDWWYYLNQHGEGKKVDFPIKVKPVIGWSTRKHIFDGKKNCSRTKVSN